MKPTLLLWGLALAAHASDDLWRLSDEFDDATTFPEWQDLGVVEGWETPSYEEADIDTTTAGRFRIVPGPLTWFRHLRGLLLFKEIDGDFVVTTRVRVLSRHNPADPTEVPNRSFSLTGIFVHAPRPIVSAAPTPYTTNAVWPPGNFGSDYVANTENYIFLSYGTAGNTGTRQFEIKATTNSNSFLYYDSLGINNQAETEAWLQMVRVGDTIVCLRKHSAAGDWIVENRYSTTSGNSGLPNFGSTLQVGITAYTDYGAASGSAGSAQDAFHYNYAPEAAAADDGVTPQPDLISEVDYYRFRRPDPALTEAVLLGMNLSFTGAGGGGQTNQTSNPPVLLSASPAAAPYLGDAADLAYDPFGAWQQDEFGPDAGQPQTLPEAPGPDGAIPNLIEFVLGGDPQLADVVPLPRADHDAAGNPTFTFTPAIADGALLEIETSATLNGWDCAARRPYRGGDWEELLPGVSVAVDEPGGEVTVTLPADTGFARLSASLP